MENTTNLLDQDLIEDRKILETLERMKGQIERRIKAHRLVMNNRQRVNRLVKSGNEALANMAKIELERSILDLEKIVNEQA